MRVLVFGVDGLAFRILDPMIEQGLLPNFQKLRDDGVRAILQSIIPPLTPPAWVSMFTGLRAAQHGVYDFWDYEQTPRGAQAPVVTHRRGGKAVWNILSEWGKRVIVANVPLTYPPEPVNGIMLSGYMAPDMNSNVTYPPAFKKELLNEVPHYQIDLDPAIKDLEKGNLLEETLMMTRERISMLKLLLQKPWDFFFITFVGADRIQHHKWDEIVSFHPQAVQYYQMLDEALGMSLAALEPDDILMVVSDHGFQGVRRKFNINEYLLKEGWLKVKDDGKYRRTHLFELTKSVLRRFGMQDIIEGLKTFRKRNQQHPGIGEENAPQKEAHAAELPDVDWANARACVLSSSGWLGGYADILFNETVTEAEIDALREKLLHMRDPLTGQALAMGIHREDAYGTGTFNPKDRHLIVIANDSINIHGKLGRASLWETTSWSMGTHHPDGVLYLYGKGVKKGTSITPVQIYDIVPTILTCMDIPVPEGLEGTMIKEAFEQAALTKGEKPTGAEKNIVMKKLQKLATRIEDDGVRSSL
jgi:predicted AlkP superfamily phosphohydrolase/phosphomutase